MRFHLECGNQWVQHPGMHSHAERGNEKSGYAFPPGAWRTRGLSSAVSIPTRSVGTRKSAMHSHAERGNET